MLEDMFAKYEPPKFSAEVIGKAWRRQWGKCAKCGIKLVVANRDRGTVGSWHPHPRIRKISYDMPDNCVLLCTCPPNDCHWNIGHGA